MLIYLKRGHAGSAIFTDFDRSALHDIKHLSNINGKPLKYYRKATDVPAGGRSLLLGTNLEPGDLRPLGHSYPTDSNYSDQLPPMTITLTGQNEYGNTKVMSLLGVEFINEGSGISIDDIVESCDDVKSYCMRETPLGQSAGKGILVN